MLQEPQDSAVRIERKTWLVLAGGAALYVVSVVAIVYWGLPSLDTYYKSRPIDNVARALVFLGVLWILLPLLPMGAYLFRYGIAVARTGRHPMPGWRFIGPQWRSGRIITGRRAMVYAVCACIGGTAILASFVTLAGFFLYMASAK